MRKKYTTSGEDFAIILGKYLLDDGSIDRELRERLKKGEELYRNGVCSRIIVSGGEANKRAGRSEAEAMKEFLSAQGIPQEAIITEEKSRNTYENARECAAILAQENYGRLYLVSSAKHLYRSYCNPYRFFRWLFKLPVKNAPACDCNLSYVDFTEGRPNCVVFFSKKAELGKYISLHTDCNVFAKKKGGILREGFLPYFVGSGIGERGEKFVEKIEKTYGKVNIVAVI